MRRSIFISALHAAECLLPISVRPWTAIHANDSPCYYRGVGNLLRVVIRIKLDDDLCRDRISVSHVIVGYASAKRATNGPRAMLLHMIHVRFYLRALIFTSGRHEDYLPRRRVILALLLRRVFFYYRVRVSVHATIICTRRRTGEIS